MQVPLLKHFSFILVVIFSYSCNYHRNNDDSKNNLKDTISDRNTKSSLVKKDSTTLKTVNYDSWPIFWAAFKRATLRKDTATIIQLTNFPFLQNTNLTDQNEFVELWISQVYGLEKIDSPILTDKIVLQLGDYQRENLPKFDSVYYTNRNQKDFYFVKVTGYYRLVEIITPG